MQRVTKKGKAAGNKPPYNLGNGNEKISEYGYKEIPSFHIMVIVMGMMM